MKLCSRCILPETYPGIQFDTHGVCNYCRTYMPFAPLNEKILLNYIEKAKRKKRSYDALVPLSGGKDSTYVLYLAKEKYNLNVLACTFDNGFLSDHALRNIETAVHKLNVDHVFHRPNWDLLKRWYRASLLQSGEFCSPCVIGIRSTISKLSADWHIPLILMGTSVTEENSYTPESIYDVNRFKAILRDASAVTSKKPDSFLLYPSFNPFGGVVYEKLGLFGKTVDPLFYEDKKSEQAITKILSEELNWQRSGTATASYGKHFDCLAEPFSNFLREHRFGYSRRACQYSNLIRLGEMTRAEALEKLQNEDPGRAPEGTDLLLKKLELTREDLDKILHIAPFKYEKYCYYEQHKLQHKVLKSLGKAWNVIF